MSQVTLTKAQCEDYLNQLIVARSTAESCAEQFPADYVIDETRRRSVSFTSLDRTWPRLFSDTKAWITAQLLSN